MVFSTVQVVIARQWGTNPAGLASKVERPEVYVLDDTPPSHPTMRLCTPGGNHDSLGRFIQNNTEFLRV